MERFATCSGLLPEQIWDEPDRPRQHLSFGKPTGSATPLLWAHAEYVKLLRSKLDGKVFDTIPVVAERYRKPRLGAQLEVWKQNWRVTTAQAGATLRIQATSPFQLHWTADEWQSANDTRSTPIPLGIEFVDIPIATSQQVPIRFTFLWLSDNRWEGTDYAVQVRPEAALALEHRGARKEGRATIPKTVKPLLTGVSADAR
jgi:glucoamylase